MEQARMVEHLGERFGEAVRPVLDLHGRVGAQVAADALPRVVRHLRDDPALRMELLLDMVGVDYLGHPQPPARVSHRLEVLQHYMSLTHGHRLTLYVPVPQGGALPSLWRLYKSANWQEREVYDLLGVRFTDHPNLRRILCHHEFQGHALRKDYPIQRRQALSAPEEILLTDDPEWA